MASEHVTNRLLNLARDVQDGFRALPLPDGDHAVGSLSRQITALVAEIEYLVRGQGQGRRDAVAAVVAIMRQLDTLTDGEILPAAVTDWLAEDAALRDPELPIEATKEEPTR